MRIGKSPLPLPSPPSPLLLSSAPSPLSHPILSSSQLLNLIYHLSTSSVFSIFIFLTLYTGDKQGKEEEVIVDMTSSTTRSDEFDYDPNSIIDMTTSFSPKKPSLPANLRTNFRVDLPSNPPTNPQIFRSEIQDKNNKRDYHINPNITSETTSTTTTAQGDGSTIEICSSPSLTPPSQDQEKNEKRGKGKQRQGHTSFTFPPSSFTPSSAVPPYSFGNYHDDLSSPSSPNLSPLPTTPQSPSPTISPSLSPHATPSPPNSRRATSTSPSSSLPSAHTPPSPSSQLSTPTARSSSSRVLSPPLSPVAFAYTPKKAGNKRRQSDSEGMLIIYFPASQPFSLFPSFLLPPLFSIIL